MAGGQGHGGLETSRARHRLDTAPFNLPNHPVVGVTWYEARRTAAGWRSGFAGKTGAGCVARGAVEHPLSLAR